MNAERWRLVDRVFQAVAFRPSDERAGMLDSTCGDDAELRAEVESMLAAHERASSFIELPAFEKPSNDPPPPVAFLTEGQRVGPFTIRGVLGRGGMGVVYEAEQDHPRRRVALKLVHPGVDTPHLRRRFAKEATLLARLTHPCVAQIYDGGTAETALGPQPYFALEIIRGEPITLFAQGRNLDVIARLRLAIDVCDAVQHAHEKGVLHRDLKPANILVTNEGRPKVLDFGVARTTDGDGPANTLHTGAGQLVGTLAYMSPEQFQSDPHTLDTRSDIYSLGVVFYELFAERLPYDLASLGVVDAARVIQERRPLSIGSFRPRFPRDLDVVLRKALEKEPARRYASADALGAELRRVLEKRPILARPPSAGYHFRKVIQRNPVAFASVAALAVGLAGLTAFSVWLAFQYAEQRDAAMAASLRESEERDTAEQTARFLAGLFAGARPGAQGTKPTRTDRELLAAGVDRLETELTDKPLVRARLFTEIGVVYGRWAEYPRALELVQKAVEIVRHERGTNHPDLIEALVGLADVLGRAEKRDEQHQILLERLRIAEAVYGRPHAEVAAALTGIGAARYYAKDFDAAIEYFERSLRMRGDLFGEESLECASELKNVGSALQAMNRLDEAEAHLRRSLDLRRRLAGAPEEIGASLEGLAHLANKRNDLSAVEEHLTEQLTLYRQSYHPRHPSIAFAMSNLAFITNRRRGPAAAEPIYRDVLAIRQSIYGEAHPDVAAAFEQLGTNQLQQAKLDEAIDLFSHALSIRRALFGDQDESGAALLGKLGNVHLRAGRLAEAEAFLQESYDLLRIKRGATGPHVIPIVEGFATLSRLLHRSEEMAEWLLVLGESHMKTGNQQAAGNAFCEAAETYERLFGGDDPRAQAAFEKSSTARGSQ